MHPRVTAVESSVTHCVTVPTVLFTGKLKVAKTPCLFDTEYYL